MTHKERFHATSNGHAYWAASTIGCPAMILETDYSVFAKSKAEKELSKDFKKLLGKTKNHKFKTIVKGQY